MKVIVSYDSRVLEKTFPGISRSAASHLFDRLDLLVNSPEEYIRDHYQYLRGYIRALFVEGYFLLDQYEDFIDEIEALAEEVDINNRRKLFTEFMLRLQKGAA